MSSTSRCYQMCLVLIYPRWNYHKGNIGLTWQCTLRPCSGRERILINRLKFRISEYTSGEGNAPKANAGTINIGRGFGCRWAQTAGVPYKGHSPCDEISRFWIFQIFANRQDSWKNKTTSTYLHFKFNTCFHFATSAYISPCIFKIFVNYLKASDIVAL